jgi:multiple sugar transport system substrate-binding protein
MNRISRRSFLQASAACVFAGALTACGAASSAAAPSSKAAASSAAASSQAGDTPCKLTFGQFSSGENNAEVLKKMIVEFNKVHPDIQIEQQDYGYDDYFTQLTAKVAGGQAPDVFELDYQNFVSYAKTGALQPIDDIVAEKGIDISSYNAMALKAFSADGVQYGVPDSFSNVVLIYNKDLFDKAGIDCPTDDWKWEDAMAAAEKIRALGDDIYGYYHPLSFNEFYKVVKQNGGGLFNEDCTKFTMTEPANVEALQYMVDMQRKTNVMPTEAQMAGMGDWDLFMSGRLGMIVTGIWAFPTFTTDCDFAWDIVMEPGHTQKAAHFFSNGYVINKDCKNAAEAAEFITFISSNKACTQLRLDASWELPPVLDDSITAQYEAMTPPDNRAAVFKSLDYLVLPPVITDYAQLQDIVGAHLSEAAAGTVTPEQCLADMQKECEEKISLTD